MQSTKKQAHVLCIVYNQTAGSFSSTRGVDRDSAGSAPGPMVKMGAPHRNYLTSPSDTDPFTCLNYILFVI